MEPFLMQRSLYLFLILSFLFVQPVSSSTIKEVPEVRIAVELNVDNIVVAVNGEYTINGCSSSDSETGIRLVKSRVLAANNRLYVGRRSFPCRQVTISSPEDIIIVDKNKLRRYRGKLVIVAKTANKLLVINKLDIERYVQGVLYHEISNRWPLEATKAQAVATRTYALYQIEQSKKREYDMTDDTYSQVYGGSSAERFRTTVAALRTKGEVLIFNGKILPAYFHSNSGGHTENVAEVWERAEPIAPLRGVPSPYSENKSNFFWKKNFRLKDIQDKLNNKGFNIGLIDRIEISERNESGRIRSLHIRDKNGKTINISGKEFRLIVGPNEIRSNNYTIEMKGYYADLIGKGWGHGVGMCQWGAYGMAEKGHDYTDILKYYYPGAEIEKIGNN
jgi:stage II sporulation protein D